MAGYLLAAAWLFVSGTSVAFVSARLAMRIAGGLDPVHRWLVGFVVAWAQIVLVLTVLGAVHLMYPAAVVVVHVALAVAAWRFLPARSPLRPGSWSLGAILVGAALAGLVGYWAVSSFGAPSAEFDTNRYHIVNAAHWLTSHEMWSLPFGQPSDHTALEPGNGELLSLWLMLPFGDDRVAYTTNLLAAVLVALAAMTVAREIGGRSWLGGVAALAVLASGLVTTAFPHSMLTDLWATGGLVGAVALGLTARRSGAGSLWVLAGLSAGLSAGTKYAELVPAFGVMVVLLAVARAPRRAVLLAASGAVATSAFWYVRNAVATGNPIYPQSLGVSGWAILPGDNSPLPVSRISLAGRLSHGDLGILGLYRDVLSTNLLPVVLLVSAGPVAWLALRTLRRRDCVEPVTARRVVLALTALCAVVYSVTPYTGGEDPAQTMIVNAAIRYLLPALVLAAVAVAVTLPPAVAWGAVALGVTARVSLLVHGDPTRSDLAFRPWAAALLAVCAGAALAGGLLLRRPERRPSMPVRTWLGAGGVAALTVAATTAAPGGHGFASLVAAARDTGCDCVVLVNVPDVRDVLAPGFDVPITSVGIGGPEGARREILDPGQLQVAIATLRPVIVVVGDDQSGTIRPAWSPPATWREVGAAGGGTAYLPD